MQLGPLGLSSRVRCRAGEGTFHNRFNVHTRRRPVVILRCRGPYPCRRVVGTSRFHVTVSKGSGRVYTNFVLSHFSSSAVVVARAAWSVFYIKPKTLLYIFAANDAAETISTANSEASGLQVQTGVYFL